MEEKKLIQILVREGELEIIRRVSERLSIPNSSMCRMFILENCRSILNQDLIEEEN